MDEGEYVLTESEALKMLTFLTTSAQGCFKEPPMYGIYRLVAAAAQLAEVWRPRASEGIKPLLDDFLARQQAQATVLGSEPGDYKAFLVETNTQLARLLKERAQTESQT